MGLEYMGRIDRVQHPRGHERWPPSRSRPSIPDYLLGDLAHALHRSTSSIQLGLDGSVCTGSCSSNIRQKNVTGYRTMSHRDRGWMTARALEILRRNTIPCTVTDEARRSKRRGPWPSNEKMQADLEELQESTASALKKPGVFARNVQLDLSMVNDIDILQRHSVPRVT